MVERVEWKKSMLTSIFFWPLSMTDERKDGPRRVGQDHIHKKDKENGEVAVFKRWENLFSSSSDLVGGLYAENSGTVMDWRGSRTQPAMLSSFPVSRGGGYVV